MRGCWVTRQSLVGALRLTIAITCLIALVGRYFWALGFGAFTATNYFGYLTIQSNMSFTVVTLIAAGFGLRRAKDPRWLTTLRGIVLTATVTSGVVFAIIMYLAYAQGTGMDVDWSDHVLHFALPPLAIAEWILTKNRGRVQWRAIPVVLGYVTAYGIFTIVRGAFVHWYPYFFLDPTQVGSLAEEAALCGVALAFFSVIASALIGLNTTRAPLRGLVLSLRRSVPLHVARRVVAISLLR
ncbi:hypothetical protein BH11ACT2_BH11ACT2_00540 [soil metagenome]